MCGSRAYVYWYRETKRVLLFDMKEVVSHCEDIRLNKVKFYLKTLGRQMLGQQVLGRRVVLSTLALAASGYISGANAADLSGSDCQLLSGQSVCTSIMSVNNPSGMKMCLWQTSPSLKVRSCHGGLTQNWTHKETQVKTSGHTFKITTHSGDWPSYDQTGFNSGTVVDSLNIKAIPAPTASLKGANCQLMPGQSSCSSTLSVSNSSGWRMCLWQTAPSFKVLSCHGSSTKNWDYPADGINTSGKTFKLTAHYNKWPEYTQKGFNEGILVASLNVKAIAVAAPTGTLTGGDCQLLPGQNTCTSTLSVSNPSGWNMCLWQTAPSFQVKSCHGARTKSWEHPAKELNTSGKTYKLTAHYNKWPDYNQDGFNKGVLIDSINVKARAVSAPTGSVTGSDCQILAGQNSCSATLSVSNPSGWNTCLWQTSPSLRFESCKSAAETNWNQTVNGVNTGGHTYTLTAHYQTYPSQNQTGFNSGEILDQVQLKGLAAANNIHGAITSVEYIDGRLNVSGWRCLADSSSVPSLEFYAGGGSATGSRLSMNVSSVTSDNEPQSVCRTNGLGQGFKATASYESVQNHAGKSVFVSGVDGSNKSDLSGAGIMIIPVETPLTYYYSTNAADNGNVEISSNDRVVIDTTTESNLNNIGLINVLGELSCPESTKEYVLNSKGIHIHGGGSELTCGSENAPFKGDISFIFNDDLQMEMHGETVHLKGIMAMGGGSLEMHGLPGKSGFVRLNGTVRGGEKTLKVDQGSDGHTVQFEVGDEIVIAPTGYKYDEADKRVITHINESNGTMTLNSTLSYSHWGGAPESFQHNSTGKSWVLDERAEVINLSRNIRIMGDENSEVDKIGAHVMVMSSNSSAKIDNVEFTRVGQMGRMARYPFHWHLMGNVSGQYIKNSSIHNSYSRCVTIHGSNGARVENNSCYDHFGHGYFLENGNEINNVITSNIGLKSKRPPEDKALLFSDFRPDYRDNGEDKRFAPPATFWITHPNNTVTNNVAAGSQGSGFWMSFHRYLKCDTDNTCTIEKNDSTGANVKPATTNTKPGGFDNNVAHSSVVGITHDGAQDGSLTGNLINENDRMTVQTRYEPESIPVFNNLVAYKNKKSGIYFRGDKAIYKNAMLANNGMSVFVTNNQEFHDSLIVGQSQNNLAGTSMVNDGVWVYDGPLYLDGVHFAGFNHSSNSTDPLPANQIKNHSVAFRLVGAARRYGDTVKRLSFRDDNASFLKMDMSAAAVPTDDAYSAFVRDVDGSLFGTQGRVIRPEHPMNNENGCVSGDNTLGQFKLYSCDQEIGQVEMYDSVINGGTPPGGIRVTRVDNNPTTEDPSFASGKQSKFSMILNAGYHYEIDNYTLTQGEKTDNNTNITYEYKAIHLRYVANNQGDYSDIIEVKWDSESKIGASKCVLQKSWHSPGSPERSSEVENVNSMEELLALSNESGLYIDGNSLYFRLKTQFAVLNSNGGNGSVVKDRSMSWQGDYIVKCEQEK